AVRAHRRSRRPQSQSRPRSRGRAEPTHRNPVAEADAMKRLLLLLGLALTSVALSSAGHVRCQERPPEPFELVRALRPVQDPIARGDTAAYLSYRGALPQLTEQLGQARDEAWKDPRNVRAAVALVPSVRGPR